MSQKQIEEIISGYYVLISEEYPYWIYKCRNVKSNVNIWSKWEKRIGED